MKKLSVALFLIFFSFCSYAQDARSVRIQVEGNDTTLEYDLKDKAIAMVESSEKHFLVAAGEADLTINFSVVTIKNGANERLGAAIALLVLDRGESGAISITDFSNKAIDIASFEKSIEDSMSRHLGI